MSIAYIDSCAMSTKRVCCME